jgi:hypothetical protein
MNISNKDINATKRKIEKQRKIIAVLTGFILIIGFLFYILD